MANKTKVTTTVTFTDSVGSQSLGGSFTRDQVGTNVTEETQTIATSATVLDIGAAITAGTLGILVIKNLDPTNYVEIATDVDMTKNVALINALEVVPIIPKAGNSYWLKAHTASVQIKFMAVEA